jgi:hypothetical protein
MPAERFSPKYLTICLGTSSTLQAGRAKSSRRGKSPSNSCDCEATGDRRSTAGTSGRSLKFRMPYHGCIWLSWCSMLFRRPTAAIAPSASPKTSSRKRIRGRSCRKTLLKRRLHSSSISQRLRAFVSTSSATKFYPSHEDPAQRFGRAFRGCPMLWKYRKVHWTAGTFLGHWSTPMSQDFCFAVPSWA